MIEAKPIPELARTAEKLARDRHNALMNDIAGETLDVMGLKAEDGWQVSFEIGQVIRPMPAPEAKPDIAPADGKAAS